VRDLNQSLREFHIKYREHENAKTIRLKKLDSQYTISKSDASMYYESDKLSVSYSIDSRRDSETNN